MDGIKTNLGNKSCCATSQANCRTKLGQVQRGKGSCGKRMITRGKTRRRRNRLIRRTEKNPNQKKTKRKSEDSAQKKWGRVMGNCHLLGIGRNVVIAGENGPGTT